MREKVYKGVITELININTNAFGIRTYRVGFESGKALFQISSKRLMPVDEGDKVLFTGEFISKNIFLIDDIKTIVGDVKVGGQSNRRLLLRQ